MTEEMTMTVGATGTVEDGTYPATLIGLEDFDYGEGNDKKTLRRWSFSLDTLDSEGNPAEIDGVSSTALGPKSKAYSWMSVLLGRKPEKGEQITRSMLLNKTCLVQTYTSDDGYSKIGAVIPTPRASGARTGGTSPASNAAAAAPVAPDAPPRQLDRSGNPVVSGTPAEAKQAVQAATGLEVDVDDIPF